MPDLIDAWADAFATIMLASGPLPQQGIEPLEKSTLTPALKKEVIVFRPTSSAKITALGSDPTSHAFAMLADLVENLSEQPDVAHTLDRSLNWIQAAFTADAAIFFLVNSSVTSLSDAAPFTQRGLSHIDTTDCRISTSLASKLTGTPQQAIAIGPLGHCEWSPSSIIHTKQHNLAWGGLAAIWREDRLLGALFVGRHANRPLTDAELNALSQMSECLATLLDHTVAFEETLNLTAQYQSLIAGAPDALTLYDPLIDRFVEVNAKAEEMFGLERAELLNVTPQNLASSLALSLSMAELDLGRPRPVTIQDVKYDLSCSLVSIKGQEMVLSTYRPSMAPDLALISTTPLMNDAPEPREPSFTERLFGNADAPDHTYNTHNQTQEARWIVCRQLEGPPHTQTIAPAPILPEDFDDAFRDPLTRLVTGALFHNRLEHCLKRARRYKDTAYSVLLLNIDCFNIVNSRFGRDKGDVVLYEAARRIESALRNTDTAARIEADEFVILLESHTSSEHAIQIAQRVVRALSEPFIINNFELFLTVSIGIATSDVGYLMSSHIVQDARASMHRAKARGGGSIEIFNTLVCNTPSFLRLDEAV